MSLSKLVAYRNQLDSLSFSSARNLACAEINKILYTIENLGEDIEQHVKTLRQRQLFVVDNFQNFETELNALKTDIDSRIAQVEEVWFEQSRKIYQNSLLFDPSYTILERQLSVSDEEQVLFHSRLSLYTTWQAPGMIIAPGRETLITQMVGTDPLYLVDRRSDLLEPVLNGFNPVYQNRLCVYVITEDIRTDMMALLPDEQMGIVLIYNFFNYRPLEVIEKYLAEVYKKLQPGGYVVMTYNDCDYWQAVNLVEKKTRAYTPGRLLKNIIKQLGYEVVHTINIDPANTWIELKKPGASITIRGGQLLATPTTKPEAIELHRLRSLAREFNMANVEAIEKYNKEQLIDLIIKSGKENLL
jgi:SAM-dependent methyltransferase